MIDIRTLRAAGLTDAQILKVIEEDQAKIREQDRIRQRNHRARNGDQRDQRDRYIDTSLLPSLEKKERKKEGRKKAHALSAQWVLTEADLAFAASKNWPQARIDSEEQRFRDYWLANGKAKADWAATWRSWVTSPYQTNGGQRGNGQGRPAPKDDPHSIRGAFDRLFEKLDREEADGELSRTPNLRIVPGGSGERP
jgi:hypothetical protein